MSLKDRILNFSYLKIEVVFKGILTAVVRDVITELSVYWKQWFFPIRKRHHFKLITSFKNITRCEKETHDSYVIIVLVKLGSV